MATEFWIVSDAEAKTGEPTAGSNIVIKAGTKAQVRQHILGKYKITPASKEMLVDLLTAECKVEEVAGDAPDAEKQTIGDGWTEEQRESTRRVLAGEKPR